MMTPEWVEEKLREHVRSRAFFSGRSASVLLPLWRDSDGGVQVVFIKRSEQMKHHRGQYAFPGGKRDETDRDVVHTALREAEEELGLRSSDVRVLGMLDETSTTSGFIVTPVVGWIPPAYEFTVQPGEVERVVSLPYRAFAEPPRAKTFLERGFRRFVPSFEVGEHVVWGATARMMKNLVDVLNSTR